jgi:hypothetical protein
VAVGRARAVAEGAAADQLHDGEVATVGEAPELEQVDDPRMGHLADGTRLGDEAPDRFGIVGIPLVEHLDRDLALDHLVRCAKYLTVTAGTESGAHDVSGHVDPCGRERGGFDQLRTNVRGRRGFGGKCCGDAGWGRIICAARLQDATILEVLQIERTASPGCCRRAARSEDTRRTR